MEKSRVGGRDVRRSEVKLKGNEVTLNDQRLLSLKVCLSLRLLPKYTEGEQWRKGWMRGGGEVDVKREGWKIHGWRDRMDEKKNIHP